MDKREIREMLAEALDSMKIKATEMGIEGVATASFLDNGKEYDWVGEMAVVGTTCNLREGWNLVAIAWSKAGEVIVSNADSGDPNRKNIMGELGFTGGAYDEHKGCKLAFSFSGASSEEDLEVAKFGITKIKELF